MEAALCARAHVLVVICPQTVCGPAWGTGSHAHEERGHHERLETVSSRLCCFNLFLTFVAFLSVSPRWFISFIL